MSAARPRRPEKGAADRPAVSPAPAECGFSTETEAVTLENGERLCVRRVRPSDKARLVRAFEGLSSLSRYRRFLAQKSALSDADLRFFTEVDGQDHYALVAVAPETAGCDGEVVGAARYIRLDAQPDTAEIAVAVVDAHQRRGIGRLLLERLRQAAYQRGIRRIRVHLLAENLPVRRLLEALFGDQPLECEGEIISGDIPLFAPESENASAARAPAFELLRLAAEGVVMPVSLSLTLSRAQLSALRRELSSPSAEKSG